MNLETLESIVGPINRGQLATKFKSVHDIALDDEDPTYFNPSEALYRPPPLTEDLTHLNGRHTEKMKRIAKEVWQRMTPKQRRKRVEHLAKAGTIGGAATKDMRHMHGL
jgi:hypothetical protein